MNKHNVQPGDVILFSNRHKGARGLLEYTYTIRRCCPKLVFFCIRGDPTREFCLPWETFNEKYDDMRAEIIMRVGELTLAGEALVAQTEPSAMLLNWVR